jgi:hypothetical protein
MLLDSHSQSTPKQMPHTQVRLVFDAPSTSALPSGREVSRDDDASDEGEEEGDEDGETGLPLNGRASKKQDSRSSRASAVVAMLQQVSEEQVQEISQVCRCVSASPIH